MDITGLGKTPTECVSEKSSAILCRGYNGVGQDPDRVSPKSLQLSCAVDLHKVFSYSIRGSMLLRVTPSDRPRRPPRCTHQMYGEKRREEKRREEGVEKQIERQMQQEQKQKEKQK